MPRTLKRCVGSGALTSSMRARQVFGGMIILVFLLAFLCSCYSSMRNRAASNLIGAFNEME